MIPYLINFTGIFIMRSVRFIMADYMVCQYKGFTDSGLFRDIEILVDM